MCKEHPLGFLVPSSMEKEAKPKKNSANLHGIRP